MKVFLLILRASLATILEVSLSVSVVAQTEVIVVYFAVLAS